MQQAQGIRASMDAAAVVLTDAQAAQRRCSTARGTARGRPMLRETGGCMGGTSTSAYRPTHRSQAGTRRTRPACGHRC